MDPLCHSQKLICSSANQSSKFSLSLTKKKKRSIFDAIHSYIEHVQDYLESEKAKYTKKTPTKTDSRIVGRVMKIQKKNLSVDHHLAHLPRGPRKPVAWHSSMKTIAPYCSARSQIPGKGATSPSIENTPSVTISRIREDCVAQRGKAMVLR